MRRSKPTLTKPPVSIANRHPSTGFRDLTLHCSTCLLSDDSNQDSWTIRRRQLSPAPVQEGKGDPPESTAYHRPTLAPGITTTSISILPLPCIYTITPVRYLELIAINNTLSPSLPVFHHYRR